MWILYSTLSAFGWATSDAFSKKALSQDNIPNTFLLWARFVFSIPFVFPFILFTPLPHLAGKFFLLHIFWLPLEISAIYFYLKAIQISPISLSLPFLSLTPLFLLFTGYILIGERPSLPASIGILLIVAGSYVMNINLKEYGFLRPIKAIFTEKGTRLIVLVAFLYSITSIIGKKLVLYSNPFFFSIYYTFVMSIATLPFGLSAMKNKKAKITSSVILSGMFYGLMILFHMLAIKTALVSYMIGLKRLSGVFSVIYGTLFFKEKYLKNRLTGAILMVLGAIMISAG